MVRAAVMGGLTLLTLLAGRHEPDGVPLHSTVLKVADHGHRAGTSLHCLQAVTPQWAVVPVGVGYHLSHPSAHVLARLDEAGVQVWRTDECGDVEVVTDGERLWVRTGR